MKSVQRFSKKIMLKQEARAMQRRNGMRMLFGRCAGARAIIGVVAAASALMSIVNAGLAQRGFPFDQEMLLDSRPLPGSRRVPMLEIAAGGRAEIDLWCHNGPGRAEVTGTSIKLTLGAMREEACTPERAQRDEDLATALAQVTQWRMERDVLVLAGGTELRYRLSTH
jgi:heat shock protein HslJ